MFCFSLDRTGKTNSVGRSLAQQKPRAKLFKKSRECTEARNKRQSEVAILETLKEAINAFDLGFHSEIQLIGGYTAFSAESIEHLLFSCKISSEFWKHVLSWLKDNGIDIETLREWHIIFGKFDIKDNFTLVNHLLLLGKYYIYSKKCQNSLPTVQGFIARIKLIYRIELQIAREKNKLSQQFIKWRKLVEVLV